MARRGPQLPTSYEDMLAGYYGHRRRHRRLETLEAVVGPDGHTARVVSLSVDDGELLGQTPGASVAVREEYVIDPALVPSAPAVPPAVTQAPVPPGAAPLAPCPPDLPAAAPAVAPGSAAAGPPAAAGTPTAPAPSSAAATPAAPSVGPPQQPATSPTQPSPPATAGAASVNEDELAADMKAILSGQSIYDHATGRTVPRDQPGASAAAPAPEASAGPPAPGGNGHAIFDAIAESMRYANAYDLGSIDLDSRFDDFDRLSELQQRSRRRPDGDADDGATAGAPAPVGGADFLQDMDAIRGAAEDRAHDSLRIAADAISGGMAHATCLPSALALAAVQSPQLAEPMYDTGEHAIAADGIYAPPLTIGAAPGVSFSYAQLVTMADLYASVEQMTGAADNELTGLKALIERSTAHYCDGSAADVTDAEWQHATGGRYLDLADGNFAHFAPDVLFSDAISSAGVHHPDHKATWEAHHRRALQEARVAGVAEPPAHAMVVNAFGDHFLTDAFAAGHLINKDAVVNYFIHGFLSGGHLTAPANAFFDRVARAAFVGDVRERFSRLETAERPAWYVPFHPNINSADRFATLLKMACESKPERVANLAVKAVHDHLNAHGIAVTNDAGDPEWPLTGDGHLTAQTTAIMQKAVQASVANVRDPALRAADDATCFTRAWRFTPKLTPASRPVVVNLVREYTNPASTSLSTAAVALITSEVDQLIHVLVDQEHKLRPA